MVTLLRIPLRCGVFVGVVVISWLAAEILQALLGRIESMEATPFELLVDCVLDFILPLVVATLVVRAIRPLRPARRTAVPARTAMVVAPLVLVGFLATGVFGVPLVRSTLQQAAEQRTRQAKPRANPQVHYPYTRTPLAVPIFPGVICSYHEYQVAPVWGEGGWYFHLWYGWGIIRILYLGRWIS